MSETTRSNASASIRSSASSAVGAAVTAQPLAVNAETRKRSSDELSSTASTRSEVTAVMASFPWLYLLEAIWFRNSIHWRVSTPSFGNLRPSNSCGMRGVSGSAAAAFTAGVGAGAAAVVAFAAGAAATGRSVGAAAAGLGAAIANADLGAAAVTGLGLFSTTSFTLVAATGLMTGGATGAT